MPFQAGGNPTLQQDLYKRMYQLVLGTTGRCALIRTIALDIRQLLQYDRDMNAAQICRLFFFPMC